MRKAAISWSAGKDSSLALLRAREAGINIRTFVTMCEPDGSSKSHALSPNLIEAQVERFGGDWLPVRVPAGGYTTAFAQVLAELAASGHTHMVFGDIDLQAHRDYIEPMCQRAGLVALFPLWGESRQQLANEIIARQIRAIVVCVDTQYLDQRYCGLEYNQAFIENLPDCVCPCGEDGEFHTFVMAAPSMSSPVPLQVGNTRLVPSAPPMNPTLLAFQDLSLVNPTLSGRDGT